LLAAKGVLAGVPVSRFYPDNKAVADILLVAATEMTTTEDMDRLEAGLREVLS
jgi:glycine dehydrogenase subunit 1